MRETAEVTPDVQSIQLHRRGVAGVDHAYVVLELETRWGAARRYVVNRYDLNGRRELWAVNVSTAASLVAALTMYGDEELSA